jgi:inosine-uridine nucleoside N-ribohydrolase
LIDTDPGVDDSMAIVYALSCPELEVVGLTSIFGNHNIDVCTRVGAKYLSTIIPFYWKFHMNTVGLDGIHLHDSSTISYMLRPDLYQTVSYPVRVDCGDGVGRGNTICAERPPRAGSKWYGRPNITIAVGVDDQAVIEMELARVC